MISRRTVMLSILALTSAPEIPTVAAAPVSVSPRMAQIIAEYKRTLAALNALDPRKDPDAWDVAENAFGIAEDALLDARPATAADFAAKFDALMFGDADDENVVLKQLSDDAHTLAGDQ